MSTSSIVNAWTEFGTLETCIVGSVHDDECHFEPEPNYNPEFIEANSLSKYMPYPCGRKSKDRIRLAQQQLEGLKDVLEAERV